MAVDSGQNTVDGEPRTVGVVGAGHIARLYHLPILTSIDRVKTVFIADLDAEKANQLATTYDGHSITTGNPADLPDVDIALLTVPVGVREGYVEAFGDRGTAIFSEKPFATTVSHHDQLQERATEIVCNYMRLNFQSTRQLRFISESELLGDLRRVRATEGEIVGATGKGGGHYQTDASLSGGGVLIQNGCHLLSQLAFVLGEPPIHVEECHIECHGSFDIDVDAALETDEGVPIEFRISQIRNLPNRIELEFDRGIVSVDSNDPAGTIKVSASTDAAVDSLTVEPDKQWATNLDQAHYVRWREFLDWIGGLGSKPSLGTGRQVTELIDSMYEAGGLEREP